MIIINKGDIIKLKEPIQGRYLQGKYKSIENGIITVLLPNGLDATRPEDEWEIVEKSKGDSDNAD